MKNRYWPVILTSLVMAVFILGMFSGVAVAQTPVEQYEKTKEQYRLTKEKYEDTRQKFEEGKDLFEKALRQFNAKKDNQSKEELILKAKNYLERAINHTIAYLNVLKNRVELPEDKEIIPFDASATVDAHIVKLEQLRTKLQQASTVAELRDINKELKDSWIDIRLETRYYLAIVLNHKIDNFIVKAENVTIRLDTAIQNLKDQGKDTADLEKYAADYKDLVKEAKDNQQKTDDLFATHNGFSSDGTVTDSKNAADFIKQATDLQKETVQKLKSASRQLIDFVKEYRKLSGGKVVLVGTGKLEANGTGRAVITGNVTVTVSGNGTMIVSSNAEVQTDGKGTKEVLGSNDVKYQGFAEATVKGENIRVEISGNDIVLKAEGTGSAVLSGKGTYTTEKDFAVSGEWNKGD